MDRGERTKNKRVPAEAHDPLDAARPPSTSSTPGAAVQVDRQRRELADVCRVLMMHAAGKTPVVVADPSPTPVPAAATPTGPTDGPGLPDLTGLSPRVRQTLDRLLLGDSEKQIARHLLVSPHTVHVYVKSLYRKLRVNSRGELLARFVRPVGAGPSR